MPSSPTLRVLGIMSGSSLDGLDLALCSFMEQQNDWGYRIDAARSVPFTDELARSLLHITGVSAFELARAHADLGDFIGKAALELLDENGGAELIASHGHTVFHQPASRFTTQIGCGARIAAITGLPAVVDFRTKDVALGGQGAPLVPIGERDLFPGFDAFLNLGGIANVSFHGATITGYDVGICNQALNHLAGEIGEPFDSDGTLARSGKLLPQLLERLNDQPFLRLALPRSMGREHFEEQILPKIDDRSLSLTDRLSTVVEHIAEQAARALNNGGATRILVTGGGAHNGFLVERIQAMASGSVIVPDARTVDFKEALVFAYLGLLRWRGLPNTLASVTGASRDSSGGAVYLPN